MGSIFFRIFVVAFCRQHARLNVDPVLEMAMADHPQTAEVKSLLDYITDEMGWNIEWVMGWNIEWVDDGDEEIDAFDVDDAVVLNIILLAEEESYLRVSSSFGGATLKIDLGDEPGFLVSVTDANNDRFNTDLAVWSDRWKRSEFKMIRLTNSFHGTETRVRPGIVSNRSRQRIRKALCGIKGCQCGETALKTHGPQDCVIEEIPGDSGSYNPTLYVRLPGQKIRL
jgi:hypothetical protein